MDGFDHIDYNEINVEKSSSMRRICGLEEIKKLFRVIEIFFLLVFLMWAAHRLPFAVRISGEYLRQLTKVVISHLFIFFLTNIIVLILFFKSRALFLQNEFHEASEFCHDLIQNSYVGAGGSSPPAEEIVYQDKQTILEVAKVRVHRRSQSVNLMREKRGEDGGGSGKKLRRSETERRRRVVELSNEEFQRTIEEFIAKQIKFHQQEKLAIVCT